MRMNFLTVETMTVDSMGRCCNVSRYLTSFGCVTVCCFSLRICSLSQRIISKQKNPVSAVEYKHVSFTTMESNTSWQSYVSVYWVFDVCVVFGWGCRGESEWWIFPAGLVVCKIMQSQLINRHVANLEIQDRSLYSKDFELFWQS